ncbi:MerR family transcriptional regulator [Paenibacillus lupini]|uniref:MerR family transcriptional regulator n=1 Tax=Paenibacillus lupini TaxID=1450204 RepID=UPI001421BF41|nr:DNA-binding transcriptional MerR regulator [Paenibacillus lupini]
MTLLKTKEAAQQLVVSETTIRRWVSTFPASFRKDMFGHYIFDAPAMNKLRQVKGQLDAGTALYDIKLPTLAEEEALAALAAEVVGAGAPVQADTLADGASVSSNAGSTVERAVALGRNANSSVLVVDRAGNVRNAGPGEVDLATAEITTGIEHAAAGAGGNSVMTLAPQASDTVQSHEATQVTVPSAPTRPSSHLFDEPDPMLERLNAIENALSQKADEVVTVQLLHHRKELEELRKSLTELAASIEAIRNPEQPSAAFEIAQSTEAEGKRKKRGFRSFFFF